MSADVTSQEDLDDIAFRALLEPLALEVLPGRSPPPEAAAARSASVVPEGAPLSHPGEQAATAIPNPADTDPAQPAIPLEAHPPQVDAAHKRATETTGLDPESRPPQPRIIATDLSRSASEMLPEDWLPPAVVPARPAAAISEMLPEDWSVPPAVASGVPAGLAHDAQPEARLPPPATQFTSSASGRLPEGRWRLTVALPDQFAGSPPPPGSVTAPLPAASSEPTVSAADPRPYRSPAIAVAEGAARPLAGPRLVARAGAARAAAGQPGGSTQLIMQRPVLPRGHVRWSVVLLAGIASAVTVACLSWLFSPALPSDVPVTGAPAATLAAPATTARPAPASAPTPAATSTSPSDPATTAAPAPQTAPLPRPASEPVPAASPAAPEAATSAPVSEPPPSSGAPSGTTPTRTQPAAPPQAMIGLLTQRGDAAVAVGDIIAARLLYERAATMGSATAATAAGKTYDLDFLLRADTHGIRPDSAAAATWYRKAAVLGDPEARTLLGRLEVQSRP